VELPSATPAAAQPAGGSAGNDCLYQLAWEALPRQPEPASPDRRNGTWLLLADRGGVAEQLARLLEARGSVCRLVRNEQLQPATAGDRESEAYRGFERVLREVASEALQGIVHLWALDTSPAEALSPSELLQAQDTGVASLLQLVQALTRDHPQRQPAVWAVTRGAQAVGEGSDASGLAHATLWGMGKSIALEHPDIWGGLLDLAPVPGPDEAAAILAELVDSQGEDQIAWRGGVRQVARLQPLVEEPAPKASIEASGTYLVTGGLGGLGLRVARWLADAGARHLRLLGRRPPGAEAALILQQLQAKGVEIRAVSADVTDAAAMAQLLDEIDASGQPLRGVVHAAGLGGQRNLMELDVATLQAVLAPKVQGAYILHQLTAGLPLDFFVCFSSIAGVWGSLGQAHYAAANHFLDVLAQYRRHRRLAGLSVAWGPWSETGMAASSEVLGLLERTGIHGLGSDEALEILGHLAGGSLAQVCVARVQWERFRGVYEARRPRPLLARLPRAEQAKASQDDAALRQALEAAAPEERPHRLLAGLQEEVARVLRLADPGQVDPEQGFFDLGMDSLMAVDLRSRLEAALQVSLPSTLVFDHPTPKALAAWLGQEVLEWEAVPEAGATAAERAPSSALLERIAQLDDEEVSVSLDEKLAKLEDLLGEK
jgi:NAD(P)-dependent dehydrogenase (short-subunit alcohol dehydrogenase family)/acyl carrier protein